MQIKTKRLKELAVKLAKSIVENERIKEMNSTSSVGGSYMTPMAFSNSEKNRKKLLKKALKQVGYKQVSEVNLNQKIRLIKAFQMRFRPELINGKIDKECLIISEKICKI